MRIDLNKHLKFPKFDAVIKFIEKKIVYHLGMRIMNKLETAASTAQHFHQIASQFDTLLKAQKPGPFGALLNSSTLKAPLGATGFLSVFNIPQNLTNFAKSIKTAIYSHKHIEKLDASLQALESSTSVVGTVDNIITGLTAIQPAIKVAQVASHVFAGFNIVNAAAGLAIKSRSIYNTHTCYRRLKHIRSTDYKSLNKFFNDNKNLAILGIDKTEKFKKIVNQKVDNSHILNRQEQAEVDALIKDLKGRLKTKQTVHSIGIITDCVNLVNSALVLASVVCPPFLIVAATFAIVNNVGIFLHKQISDYKFEQKMGLTQKCPTDLKGKDAVAWKVNHFFKWNYHAFFHPNKDV